MGEKQNIMERLIAVKNNLPKKQKIVCDYVMEHPQEVSVSALPELAKKIGVGQTTIVRFMKNVGFDSYITFKKQFRRYTMETSQPTWWHLEKSLSNQDGTINKSWTEIMNILAGTMTQQLADNFEQAIELMINAKSINIVSFRTSKVAGMYFEYMLSEFYPNIPQFGMDSDFIYDRLLHLDKNDVVVFIAISPYTSLTVEAAEYCHEKGIPIILITDRLSCPISSVAENILHVKASDNQYSIVPAIALIETLVIAIGQRISGKSVKHLEQLNQLLMKKNITTT